LPSPDGSIIVLLAAVERLLAEVGALKAPEVLQKKESYGSPAGRVIR